MKNHSGFDKYFEGLAGSWVLKREISSGETVDGRVEFLADEEGGFLVDEAGQMRLPNGHSVSAKRRWRWYYNLSSLLVYFDENPLRLYHDVKISANDDHWLGDAEHLCHPDTYCGAYQFFDDQIVITQDVLGPKKDYRIRSIYCRN